MANFEVKDIRTIGIIGANGSGKTTLVDALMYAAGANTRQGSVDQGSSLSDTSDEEKARKTSIRATCLNCRFEGRNIFLIDTPGYADFWGEVIVTMEVVDSVVIVLDGVTGLDPGTRRAWKAAREKGLPISFFVTKLDKEHSNFAAVLASLEGEGGSAVVPLVLPDGNYPDLQRCHRTAGRRRGRKSRGEPSPPDRQVPGEGNRDGGGVRRRPDGKVL